MMEGKRRGERERARDAMSEREREIEKRCEKRGRRLMVSSMLITLQLQGGRTARLQRRLPLLLLLRWSCNNNKSNGTKLSDTSPRSRECVCVCVCV